VDHLHDVYFQRKAYYFIGEGGGVAGKKMSDADHRITDDVKQTAQVRRYILVAAGTPSRHGCCGCVVCRVPCHWPVAWCGRGVLRWPARTQAFSDCFSDVVFTATEGVFYTASLTYYYGWVRT
jgi:hypothetical protein